jgi:hypothetical protein
LRSTSTRTVRAACASVGLFRALAHPFPLEVSLFDPARVPASVTDKMAVIGYWYFSRDLRDKLDGWDDLDEGDAAVAENELELMGSVLARS